MSDVLLYASVFLLGLSTGMAIICVWETFSIGRKR